MSENARKENQAVVKPGNGDKIYLSGPVTDYETGQPAVGFARKFLRAERRLGRHGYETVNPCRFAVAHPLIYKLLGLTWKGWRPSLDPKISYRRALVYDLWRLTKCDVIYMLDGYYRSGGARVERKLAQALGLPVMYEHIEMQQHLTDEEKRERKRQKRQRQKARRAAEKAEREKEAVRPLGAEW